MWSLHYDPTRRSTHLAGPLRHRVGFAPAADPFGIFRFWLSCGNAFAGFPVVPDFDPFGNRCERAFAGAGGLIRFDFGKFERKRGFGKSDRVADFAFLFVKDRRIRLMIVADRIVIGFVYPDDRKRFAPEALTGEKPVAKFVLDGRFSNLSRSEIGSDFSSGFF